MTDLNIKKPCVDCPLYVGSGEDLLDIYDKRLLLMCRDGIERALGCKHPWRVANERFGGEPNSPQKLILSQLVEFRGLNPADYGLEPTTTKSEAESGDVEWRTEVIYTITNELIIAFNLNGPEIEILEEIERTLTEYYSDPEIPAEWVDEALTVAQAIVAEKSE